MVSRDDFEGVAERAALARSNFPKAISARYDQRLARVLIRLNSGIDVGFSPRDTQGLEHADVATSPDRSIAFWFWIALPRPRCRHLFARATPRISRIAKVDGCAFGNSRRKITKRGQGFGGA
jgi:hypothetical protein